MENFEFKSQICTTKEQSERLLALGLKKETADCYYQYLNNKWELRFGQPITYGDLLGRYFLPAWSLHRLLMMYEDNYNFFSLKDAYNHIIDAIELDIHKGIFNPQFLEDKK